MLAAEFLGTFVLVLGGCGAAVLAAVFTSEGVQLGIGFLGVALAFGFAVVTMAYAVGHVSGGHFNPAVTIGLAAGGRLPRRTTIGYMATQVVGAVVAAAVLFLVASGAEGFSATESGFASNGYGDRSPGGYGLLSALIIEVVLTAVFLYVILGVTDTRAPKGFAPVGHRAGAHLDPPHQHPGHEHLGEPGPVDRAGSVRRRRRHRAVVAVHPRSGRRRAARRLHLFLRRPDEGARIAVPRLAGLTTTPGKSCPLLGKSGRHTRRGRRDVREGRRSTPASPVQRPRSSGTAITFTDPSHDEVACAGDAAGPQASAIVAP